jgi:pyruvate/2-oxoglutarate dehydrogenase complex dihydrolipoamide acyltransferase (E2) component
MLAGAVIALAWIDGAQAQTGANPASLSQETAPAAPAAATAPAKAVAPEAAAPAERVAAADAPAAAASAESAAADDPMVCRTQVETGTIGRRQKICMTKSEWEKHRQASRKYLRSVNQSRSTQPGGESLGP